MDVLFNNSSSYASLAIRDLVDARNQFHYHLMSKKNVVGTALGLYRVRKADRWPSQHHPPTQARSPKSDRRTLFNSEVRPYSWPCVYVFVSNWQHEAELAAHNPSDVVPKTLYLPDGRSVPVCVIEARLQPRAKDLQVRPEGGAARNLLRPGCAIVNEDGQGMTRLATAGCIVRDGQRYYVLTNNHAVGAPGTTIRALQTNRRPAIGTSADKGLTRVDFSEIYPHLPAPGHRLLMDIGLIDLDDILQWKTEIGGIAPIGPVLDLYDNNLSLKLIAMKVVGQSAVSGPIRGEIHALFYRHKSMGGSEYISDFLIGPETYGREVESNDRNRERDRAVNVALEVQHGDSGTLLLIEHVEHAGDHKKPTTTYYPFALLWGKQEFLVDGKAMARPFALATALAPALDRLDLDLVRDINLDQEAVWGWVGHYVIGRSLGLPVDLITSEHLRKFVAKNLDLLAIQPNDALDNDPRAQPKGGGKAQFVALADVPDNVWKSNVNFIIVDGPDGKKKHKPGPGNRGQTDNKNHFADLDLEYLNGKTFLQLNLEDPDTYLNPKAWVAYFAAMKPKFDAWAKLLDDTKGPGFPDAHWGALPFRVHQLFDVMRQAAVDDDAKLFLCAGGVLIHYIGDACQPLHASYLSQGDPARVVKRPRSDKSKLEADGVHSGYEDDMIAYGCSEADLVTKLQKAAKRKDEDIPDIATGHDAAKAVIALIAATQGEISPREIVEHWVMLNGTPKKDKAEAMWQAFGDRTVVCMARGTRYLAKIWQAAWNAGNGDATIRDGSALKPAELMALYNDPDVVPSIPLDHYPDDQDADWSTIQRVLHNGG